MFLRDKTAILIAVFLLLFLKKLSDGAMVIHFRRGFIIYRRKNLSVVSRDFLNSNTLEFQVDIV
ncbi:MAG: hypothetical protein B6D58_06020 [candidate division Zixibacteria bacterium 4484_95]|nr:MAG: hypothetical protein B6D58_06020 [candidate division Zixibacteria bacterium 4484_95]